MLRDLIAFVRLAFEGREIRLPGGIQPTAPLEQTP